MLRKLCLLAFAFLPATAAISQGFLPIVAEVSENTAGTEITINGASFGNAIPGVMLAGTSLKVLSATKSTITAQLPSNTAPGSYLLTVVNNSTHLPTIFEATLGAQGLSGAGGPQGPQGSQGFPGLQGPVGPSGIAGAQGPAGPAGTPGATGAQGPIGATGATGTPGLQGSVGLTGAMGTPGPAGAVGATGAQGPVGATGAPGAQGIAGATGPTGLQGATGMIGAMGPTGAASTVAGPTGAIGPTGATGAAGTLSTSQQGQLTSLVSFQSNFGNNTGNAGAGSGQTCTLGEVLLTASGVANGTPANGQTLSISQNAALFALLGISYGGNGVTTFMLPNLRSIAPNNMTYSICTVGIFPSRN